MEFAKEDPDFFDFIYNEVMQRVGGQHDDG